MTAATSTSHALMSTPPVGATEWSWTTWARRGAVLAVGLAFPFLASPLWLNVAVLVLFATIGAQALNLLTGLVGQVSIGNAAFLALGSMGTVFAGVQQGWSLLVAVLVGTSTAAVVGGVFAVFAFRLRGFYLALGTIALLYAVTYGFGRYQFDQVGASSFLLPFPEIAGRLLVTDRAWFFLLLVVNLLLGLGFANLLRSRFGRAAAMVKDRETESVVFGISPRRVKVTAFVWSSALIGLQGSLFAYYIGSVSYNTFTLEMAIQYVAMVVIGGLGLAWGGFIGATYVVALPYVLSESGLSTSPSTNLLIYGASIVVFLLWAPSGIAGLGRTLVRRFRPAARPGRGDGEGST